MSTKTRLFPCSFRKQTRPDRMRDREHAMADWRVIESAGRTLVRLIERRIAALAIPNVTVSLNTTAAFSTLASTAAPVISLFLFQIAGNAELRNRPRQLAPDGRLRRQSLP